MVRPIIGFMMNLEQSGDVGEGRLSVESKW